MKYLFAILVCIAVSLSGATPTYAQVAPLPVYDPAVFTQLSASHSTQVETLLKHVQEIQHQIEMVNNQAQQIKMQGQQLAALPQGLWAQAQAALTDLADVMDNERQQVSSEVKVSTIFHSLYPSYSSPIDFSKLLQAWYYNNQQAGMDVLKTTENAIQVNQKIRRQTDAAGTVVANGAQAKSQMQVMQGAAQLAQLQVTALQNLGDIQALQAKFQALYMMTQLQQDQKRNDVDQGTTSWINKSIQQGNQVDQQALMKSLGVPR